MMNNRINLTPRERKLQMLRDLDIIIKTLGPGSVRDDLVYTHDKLLEELAREEEEEESSEGSFTR